MAPEGSDRSDGFDDLFEELDGFFAGGSDSTRRERRSRDPTGEAAAGSEGQGGGVAGADDLLPPGWKPDIEGLDVAAGHEPEASGPSEASEESEESPGLAESEVGSEADAGQSELPEPTPRGRRSRRRKREPQVAESTGEMTSEDWTRLRDAIGEEPGEDEAFAAAERGGAPGPLEEEELRAEDIPEWREPGAGRELTLDDLKKAPPEYGDLPKPEDETGERAVTGAQPTRARPAEQVAADSGAESDEAVDALTEPTIDEVEAAADHLAEDFRETPEPRQVEEELLADLEEPTGPRTVKVGAAETLAGPTWEEPTSRPLTAEPIPPPAGARDMPAALLTAAVLAVVALVALAIAKALFVVVAGAVVLLGQWELYVTMTQKGHRPATALGLAVGGLTMTGAYLRGEPAMVFFVALGLFLTFLWYMAAPLKSREDLIGNVGATMVGVLYGPFLAGYVFLLLAQRNSGRALMLLVIALTFVYDISAYALGSFWGSRPLAPTISPRKSWEGVLGGTFVSFALAAAFVPSVLDYFSLTKAIGLAIVVVVFAPLGDLVESLIKRDLAVKDMGSVLPGHGGVLDRIDSLLLVAPAVFYYLRLIF